MIEAVAVRRLVVLRDHPAVGGGVDRLTAGDAEVDAVVQAVVAVDRVHPHAVRRRDRPGHRPVEEAAGARRRAGWPAPRAPPAAPAAAPCGPARRAGARSGRPPSSSSAAACGRAAWPRATPAWRPGAPRPAGRRRPWRSRRRPRAPRTTSTCSAAALRLVGDRVLGRRRPRVSRTLSSTSAAVRSSYDPGLRADDDAAGPRSCAAGRPGSGRRAATRTPSGRGRPGVDVATISAATESCCSPDRRGAGRHGELGEVEVGLGLRSSSACISTSSACARGQLVAGRDEVGAGAVAGRPATAPAPAVAATQPLARVLEVLVRVRGAPS